MKNFLLLVFLLFSASLHGEEGSVKKFNSLGDIEAPELLNQNCTYLGNGFGFSGSNIVTRDRRNVAVHSVSLMYECRLPESTKEFVNPEGHKQLDTSTFSRTVEDYAKRLVYNNMHSEGMCRIISSTGGATRLTEKPGTLKYYDALLPFVLVSYQAVFSCEKK